MSEAQLQRLLNHLTLLANLGILAIVVKVYTEILKDRKFDVRERRSGHDGGRLLPGTPGRFAGVPIIPTPAREHGTGGRHQEIPDA